MASPRGCFKTGCLGCLGFLAIILLIVGVIALFAWNDSKTSDPKNEVVQPLESDEGFLATGHGGRVVLNLSNGDFQIRAAEPGQGLRMDVVYDDALFDMTQDFKTLPDSTWSFEVGFFRTSTGMRAFLQSVFSKGPSAKVTIYLPPEVPVELVGKISQGALEGDFGGLWLSSIDLELAKGGFVLDVSQPMREPVEHLRITSSMGGMEVDNLGNASPLNLNISCKMGGGQVNLDGAWRNDCNVDLAVKMGGISVLVPPEVKVLRGNEESGTLAEANSEVEKPTLRFQVRQQYGEIEIIR